MRNNDPWDEPYREAEALVQKFIDATGGEAEAFKKIRELRG